MSRLLTIATKLLVSIMVTQSCQHGHTNPRTRAKLKRLVLVVERWVLAQLSYHTFHSLATLNQAIKALMQDLNQWPMKGYGAVSPTN